MAKIGWSWAVDIFKECREGTKKLRPLNSDYEQL